MNNNLTKRVSKKPERFHDLTFLKGSGKKGEKSGVHFDGYDRGYHIDNCDESSLNNDDDYEIDSFIASENDETDSISSNSSIASNSSNNKSITSNSSIVSNSSIASNSSIVSSSSSNHLNNNIIKINYTDDDSSYTGSDISDELSYDHDYDSSADSESADSDSADSDSADSDYADSDSANSDSADSDTADSESIESKSIENKLNDN